MSEESKIAVAAEILGAAIMMVVKDAKVSEAEAITLLKDAVAKLKV